MYDNYFCGSTDVFKCSEKVSAQIQTLQHLKVACPIIVPCSVLSPQGM